MYLIGAFLCDLYILNLYIFLANFSFICVIYLSFHVCKILEQYNKIESKQGKEAKNGKGGLKGDCNPEN